jgi:hypothetical protein
MFGFPTALFEPPLFPFAPGGKSRYPSADARCETVQ